ncbi:MAG: efflux RND transporter permease subunit, partial [Limnohabitans sp.]|nr:efflux RND transporter permease subunit [Limnohabitans sp.]
LLGVFAVLVTPREEEPQINVTMANVLIPFPGASVKDVEQMVSGPAEQVLSQIAGVEHVMSVSQPGLSVVTVQYKVGIPRTEALVRLYDTVNSHADWLPKGLGVLQPLIKPKGIDDVPILTLTLFGKEANLRAFELERVAQNIEIDLKRVKGTREVTTVGGPSRAIQIEINPARMQTAGITVPELRMALQSAHLGAPVGDLLVDKKAIAIESGPFLSNAKDVASLVVGVRAGNPVLVQDIAQVRDGGAQANTSVWHGVAGKQVLERTAVTIAVTKKPGENAIEVSNAVLQQVAMLKQSKIPPSIDVTTTRNYGETANDKAQKLIQKLLFATASVVALVFVALGRREAAIVGTAVILTLTVTLFASWAWGFTLNRVSLFALIFSIGILVDDAIVVVENIHRHQTLFPHKTLIQIIPGAVDEVGAPTILATLTVIAALLPMAFVTGLMGPYMSPIPINASMGMLLSLAVAFVVTPWLARIWMKPAAVHEQPNDHHDSAFKKGLNRFFKALFAPFLSEHTGARNRWILGAGVLGAIVLSVSLPVAGWVALKMLPFDNKSEFQVVVDMPAGTRVEETEKVLRALGAHLAAVPEVTHYQAYAGLS